MYGIFTYIYHILPLKTTIHVSKYTIYGCYGYVSLLEASDIFFWMKAHGGFWPLIPGGETSRASGLLVVADTQGEVFIQSQRGELFRQFPWSWKVLGGKMPKEEILQEVG